MPSNSPICRWIARAAVRAGALVAGSPRPAFCQGFPPDARIDAIFSQWDKPDSPGCSLAVAKAGTTVYSRGYGTADLDHHIPNTPSTVFHAASLAKQFTAMCIMLLVGQGRLQLGDDVRRYVPELPDFGARITIADMLHHISGIRDQWVLITMAGWRMSDDVITRQDVLDLVERMETLNFPPGTNFSYSNTNYTLASLIVESASGLSFRQSSLANIFLSRWI